MNMNSIDLIDGHRIDAACERACAAIAPAWPLDRAIAVNPHWNRVDRPVRTIAARMAVLGGIRVFPSRQQVKDAWQGGRIAEDDLQEALRRVGRTTPVPDAKRCIAALDSELEFSRLPLLIDVLDDDPEREERLSWRQAITHQVSQTCASYFDKDQADWQPDRGEGLYSFWRDAVVHDLGIGVLMGIPELHQGLRVLPHTREQAERWVLERLNLPESVWSDYLEAVLLSINGWASWCAYLGWEARQAGRADPHLRDLLAIRLAWGAILLDCKDPRSAANAFAALKTRWQASAELFDQTAAELIVDEVWQEAYELGYQRQLAARLIAAGRQQNLSALAEDDAIQVQAAFCIDVRSEPLRRAVEAVWPSIQTVGFAGFFGLPIAYTPFGTGARRPQLPGLLAPALEVEEQPDEGARTERQRRFAWADAWGAATRWPASAFSYVESAGVGYLAPLAGWLRPKIQPRERLDLAGLGQPARLRCRPVLTGLDTAGRTELAAKVLKAMGLDRGCAPLVLLIGHGSQTLNNPHAAALDCGACCGQTGEVNARVLAELLNDVAVRQGLKSFDIEIPDQTHFVAALHNTTTDEIEYFDLQGLPPYLTDCLQRVRAVFDQAGDQVRRERASRLGIDPRCARDALLGDFRRRANDGAQTRPEWGLAGNAAFIIAPRRRSAGALLEGRCFLHDYDAKRDTDGSLLELLMTAPMLVTHWINWQYHASTCDPERLGSGNKVLHNVVGGRIGVFEGNGGDLRIGLPRQSVHDGQRWMHEPLRLTVLIDAPVSRIERVIAAHPLISDLVEHGWIHLWRWEGDVLLERVEDRWTPVFPKVAG